MQDKRIDTVARKHAFPFIPLAPLRLRFAPSAETEFRDHFTAKNRAFSWIALLSGILFFMTFGCLDVLLAEQHEAFLLLFRFAVVLPILLGLLFALKTQWAARHLQGMLALAGLVTGAATATMIAVAFDEVGRYYFFGIIIVNFYAQSFARMRFIPSALVAFANIAFFNLALYLSPAAVSPVFTAVSNFFVMSSAVLGAVTAFSIEKLERHDFQQTRSLSESSREHERNSRTDAMTGLPNRRCLTEQLADLEQRAKSTRRKYSVAIVDIDHFKRINDHYGHDAGDAVLKRVALELRRHLRGDDVVGRWGGEEFMIIFPQSAGAGARLAAIKLSRTVRALQVAHDDQEISVTATFGIAEGAAGDAVQEVVRRADIALYDGKRGGRDNVVLHVAMHAETAENEEQRSTA